MITEIGVCLFCLSVLLPVLCYLNLGGWAFFASRLTFGFRDTACGRLIVGALFVSLLLVGLQIFDLSFSFVVGKHVVGLCSWVCRSFACTRIGFVRLILVAYFGCWFGCACLLVLITFGLLRVGFMFGGFGFSGFG